jgi:hypothetical protein
MRRVLAVLLILCGMIMLCSLTAYADSAGFTIEFVPQTETGAIFCLDLCSEEPVGAAVFELSFDAGTVDYREIKGSGGASVQAAAQDGCIRIAYAHPTGGSGALLRLTFKALTNTETTFLLHTEQAADAQLRYLTCASDYSLTADVGRQKVIRSGTVKTTAKTEKSTEKTEKSAKTSSRSAKSGSVEADDDIVYPVSGTQSVANREGERWFVIGICVGAGVLLTAALAFLIGKRIGRRSIPQEEPQFEPACGVDEENEDNSDTE